MSTNSNDVRIQRRGRGYVVSAPEFYTWQEDKGEARDWAQVLRRERAHCLRRAGSGRRGPGEWRAVARSGEPRS